MPMVKGLIALTAFLAALNGLIRVFHWFWGMALVFFRPGVDVEQVLMVFKNGLEDPEIRSIIIESGPGGQKVLDELDKAGDNLGPLVEEWSKAKKELKNIVYCATRIAKIRKDRLRWRKEAGWD